MDEITFHQDPASGYAIAPETRTQMYGDSVRWASVLTTRRHLPELVIAHTDVIFAFLIAATGKRDLETRHRACALQHANDLADRSWKADDDPEGFVRRAHQLYAAMALAGYGHTPTHRPL